MGSEGTIAAFFTSSLDGGECSASGPDRFTPEQRDSGTHCHVTAIRGIMWDFMQTTIRYSDMFIGPCIILIVE